MKDLSATERVFRMPGSMALIVAAPGDLDAERHQLETLIEHCRSWESELAHRDQMTPRQPQAGHVVMTKREGLWEQQLACLEALAPYVPKRRALKLRRKALIAVCKSVADGDFLCDRPFATRATNEFVVDVRIREMDQVIAAAFRAAKKRLAGHGGSHAK